MKNSNKKKILGGALLISIVSLAGNVTDRSQLGDKFAVPPVLVTVQSPNGNSNTLCVAGVLDKKNQVMATAVFMPSTGQSCKDRPSSSLQTKETKAEQTYQTRDSKPVGDPYEQGAIDQNLWLFQSSPTSVYYKTIDVKSGTSQWDAFCVATIYPDPRYKTVGAPPPTKMLFYKRVSDPSVVTDPDTAVKCGPMSFALGNPIKTEKPRFIGSPAEIQKLTAHKSQTPQQATASRAHAERP